MNHRPDHITINGEKVEIREFIARTHQQEYLKKLSDFLKAWYAPDLFIEVNTSGSTGTPKTIRLDKTFVAQSALRTLEFFHLQAKDRILHCLPMDFIAGRLMVVRALLGSLDLVPVDPSTDFSFLETEKFRFAAMIPHQVAKIVNREITSGSWLNRIDLLLLGGSSVPAELENQLQLIDTDCYCGYAMTETATHIALRKINGPGKSPFYRCLHPITIDLSDKGCLQIYMPGIEKQPLQTTDLAEITDDKTFRLTGRKDNIIISGGIKYAPEQLEKRLEAHIDRPFLITARPHPTLGSQLVLFVEGSGSPAEAKRLKEICAHRLDKHEQPKQIQFIDRIPKTANGKIDRKKV